MIILSIDRIFDFEERESTLTLSHAIACVSNESRKVLAKWLAPLDKDKLLLRVESLQTLLSVELLKLMPDEEEPDYKAVESAILGLCYLMDVLFQSNKYSPRLSHDHFLNTQITEHVDPISQIKMSYRNKAGLNFTKFPFLLDLNYKSVRHG